MTRYEVSAEFHHSELDASALAHHTWALRVDSAIRARLVGLPIRVVRAGARLGVLIADVNEHLLPHVVEALSECISLEADDFRLDVHVSEGAVSEDTTPSRVGG